MAIFEEVTLVWKEREYKIPSDQIMRVIAKVEDVLTMVQLHRYREREDLPIGKLAQAFGIVLRHAGANVTDEEVYEGIFQGDNLRKIALEAVTTLQMMMLPPSALRKGSAPETGKSAETSKGRSSKSASKRQ